MTYTPHNRNNTRGIPAVGEVMPTSPPDSTPQSVDLGGDTGALLAAVPAMLGFVPENSMILLGLSNRSDSQEEHPLPDRGGRSSCEVGPVVRADLAEQSVTAAVDAVIRANRGRADSSVIIVVVGGDADPLVNLAHRRFAGAGVRTTAAFLVTDMRAGAMWWEIAVDGGPHSRAADLASERTWACGELGNPSDSPAVVHRRGTLPAPIIGQRQFDTMLDPVEVPESLREILPPSWREGQEWESGGTEGEDRDVAHLCSLVSDLSAVGAGPGSVHPSFPKLLEQDGCASFISRVCDSPRLSSLLPVLATGPCAEGAVNLLTGTARLSRGPLRQRSLTLLAVVAWCHGGGVLTHRAAHRAMAELADTSRNRRKGPVGMPSQAAFRRAELTVELACDLVSEVTERAPGQLTRSMLDVGVSVVDQALHQCPADELPRLGELLDRVVDRAGVNCARSELDRRAGR